MDALSLLIGSAGLVVQINKSMKIDEETTKKNIRAFTRTAEAERKLQLCRDRFFNKLVICAKRKNGILIGPLKRFIDIYENLKKLSFTAGAGIEELDKIGEITNQISQCVSLPDISSGKIMSNSQLLVTYALTGIGGLMIKDSKMNLDLAKRNLSQANAISAQIDTICIALDGIGTHADIITDTLQKLGMLYNKSLNNVSNIFKTNGYNFAIYSDDDIAAIDISKQLTTLIFRIINTPIVDENGAIEKESIIAIESGRQMLDSIENKYM